MNPTAIALQNVTSVGTLTDYLPKCAKDDLQIDWGFASVNSLLFSSNLSPFSYYKWLPVTPLFSRSYTHVFEHYIDWRMLLIASQCGA